MSDENPTPGIEDEQLPEDLQPSDDNPLAKPLSDRDDPLPPEKLDMHGGKLAEEMSDESEDDSADDSDETSASDD